jgi:N-acylneuraminate cytidylyltransferase
VAKPSYILKADSIFDGKVSAYEVPAERAIDIDSKLDFEFAEHILRGILKNQIP